MRVWIGSGRPGLHDIGGLMIYGLSIAATVAALQGDLDALRDSVPAQLAPEAEDWAQSARLCGAWRPNLSAWGHQSRWWTAEPRVREAVGEARFEQLSAEGGAAAPETIMEWVKAPGR